MARKKVAKNIYYDDAKRLYYVSFYYGVDPKTGKPIRKNKTVKSKREAKKLLTEFEYKKDINAVTRPSEHTVKTWLEYWITKICEPNLQKTTVYGYKQIIKNHIEPILGSTLMQKVTVDQVQRYYADRLKHLAPNTVLKHHALLKTAFDVAVKQDVIAKSPIDRVQTPKRTHREITPYNAEQLSELLYEALYSKLGLVVVLAAYLGLRRGEILGLKWEDVDFVGRTISIKRTRTSAGSEVISKTPKTFSSNRLVYMPDRVWEEMDLAERRNAKNRLEHGHDFNKEGYVIVDKNGKPYRPNYISELFTKVVTEKGFPKLTLHGLRHTFVSLANAQGHTMHDISKMAGHSRIDTTSRLYTHMFEKANETIATSVSKSIEMKMTDALPPIFELAYKERVKKMEEEKEMIKKKTEE